VIDVLATLAPVVTKPEISWVAIVGAISGAVTAVGGFIVAIFVLIPSLKVNKQNHVMLNQQRTDSQNYQRALITALKQAHIEVPEDQSNPSSDKVVTESAVRDS
jgi:hypothetical protein